MVLSQARGNCNHCSVRSQTLLGDDLGDLQIWIRVVPLGGDVLKGQAERFRLAGRERRQGEVDGFIVRSAGAQHANGKFVALRGLAQLVLEGDLHHCVSYGLIAGVGDGTIDVTDGLSGKILRGTCRHVGEFQVRGIGWRRGGLFLLGAKNQGENADHNPYDDDPDEDRTQAGLLPLCRGIYVWLDQAIHGGIVLPGQVSGVRSRVSRKAKLYCKVPMVMAPKGESELSGRLRRNWKTMLSWSSSIPANR